MPPARRMSPVARASQAAQAASTGGSGAPATLAENTVGRGEDLQRPRGIEQFETRIDQHGDPRGAASRSGDIGGDDFGMKRWVLGMAPGCRTDPGFRRRHQGDRPGAGRVAAGGLQPCDAHLRLRRAGRAAPWHGLRRGSRLSRRGAARSRADRPCRRTQALRGGRRRCRQALRRRPRPRRSAGRDGGWELIPARPGR